jgi:hypothetical protein
MSDRCEECRAIRLALREAYLAARDHTTNPQEIAAWLEQLNEQDCARMRANSSLWKTWRRLMQHRTLTGHFVSYLPLSRKVIANPN